MRRFLTTAFLLTCALTAAAASDPGLGLTVRGDAPESERLLQLAVDCVREAAYLLDISPAGPELTIVIGAPETEAEGRSNPGILSLSADVSLPVAIHRIARKVILRTIDSEEHLRPASASSPVDWLAAALVFAMREQPRVGPVRYPPDYGPARTLLAARDAPNVDRLVKAPVPPSAALAYRLYSLHCHLLVNTIRNSKADNGPGFSTYLNMIAQDRDALEALTFLVRPSFLDGEDLQSWYQRRASRLARRGRYRASIAEVRRRWKNLRTVRLRAPGPGGAVVQQTVPLENLAAVVKEGRITKDGLTSLQRQFFELNRDAPPLVQPALLQYVSALRRLSQGKLFFYRENVRAADEAFAERAARQERVENYLDNVQRAFYPPEVHLMTYLRAMHTSREQRRQLDPELNNYLKRIEDKLLTSPPGSAARPNSETP